MPCQFTKDPDATISYQIDWEKWLNEDTIDTSSWTADSGLTVVTDSSSSTRTTVQVSGGTAGETYELLNRITTQNGDETDRTLIIRIINK